jgi:membrane protease YdiL (CAAX protease family)
MCTVHSYDVPMRAISVTTDSASRLSSYKASRLARQDHCFFALDSAFSERLLWACGSLGALVWLLGHPPVVTPPGSVVWLLVVLAPVLEETVFRAGVHESLLRTLGQRAERLVIANVLTALLFAAGHVINRGDAQSLLTFFPALVIGAAYQRHRQLAPCIAMHAFFNVVWLTVTW